MGFKSIELQVAIPRSQDAGKMQEQLMRQGQQFQETLTQQQLREEVINRGKVNEYENVQDSTEDKDSSEKQKQKQKQKNKIKVENAQPIDHPYLGKNIDFSG
ncbi:hypothetical protein SPD48_02875 [Pseudogracilibacillus sp. SE30717A]|uniref:hypothetical protein n=1 Tax=Pseudogracilibacillus sp. SE30717A TaxID=3098293 RepID=UPI00300E2630